MIASTGADHFKPFPAKNYYYTHDGTSLTGYSNESSANSYHVGDIYISVKETLNEEEEQKLLKCSTYHCQSIVPKKSMKCKYCRRKLQH